EVDALISPSLDLTTVQNPSLKFHVAYAKRDANSADKLSIYSSVDCGESWNLRYIAPTYLLQADSVENQLSHFIPQGPNEWKEIYVPLPAGLKSQKNVRFKFAFEAGGGNNIYLDNVRIEGNSTS